MQLYAPDIVAAIPPLYSVQGIEGLLGASLVLRKGPLAEENHLSHPSYRHEYGELTSILGL